jgi:hypothetical protein
VSEAVADLILVRSMRAAVLTALLLAGCANPAEQAARHKSTPARYFQAGKTYCGVHRKPLTIASGFRTEGIILEHPMDLAAKKDDEANPNRIPAGYSLTRTKDCIIPTQFEYCTWCEEGIGHEFY